jgi:hypothetical protein
LTITFGVSFTTLGRGPSGSRTEFASISSPNRTPPTIVKYLNKLGIMAWASGLYDEMRTGKPYRSPTANLDVK